MENTNPSNGRPSQLQKQWHVLVAEWRRSLLALAVVAFILASLVVWGIAQSLR